jgi:hypothetical protein
MYRNKEFADDCGKHRDYGSDTSFFHSKAFHRLDRRCNGRIGQGRRPEEPSTSVWELGGDGVELMTFGTRKAAVLGLRCEELPPHLSHTDISWRPLIIVEGPREKTNLDGILKAPIDTFIRHAPVNVEGMLTFCQDVKTYATFLIILHVVSYGNMAISCMLARDASRMCTVVY